MTASSRDISVRSPDGEFAAYLAVPATPNGVAIVVLQEIFGVNANIRAIADGFAAQGYVAIAPDLYWRQAPGIQLNPGSEEGRAQATELMKGLDRNQAVNDSVAALAAAREQVAGITRSAAIGYCFGGGVAYLLAVRNLVDAGIAYYGTYLHTLLGEAGTLEGQLLLHIAETDHLCPPEAQQAIQAALAPLAPRATVVVHPGAGHAFARIGGATFNAEAAERANGLTADLLKKLVDAA